MSERPSLSTPQLIPKPPKRKRQPTAAIMREQLALAADEIIRLRSVIETTKFFMGWDRPPEAPPTRMIYQGNPMRRVARRFTDWLTKWSWRGNG